MTTKELNNWYYNLGRNWQLILKYNIFNWFNGNETLKINNDNYKLLETELYEIYFLECLSTVIPDNFGSEGYTPDIDCNIIEDLKHLKHLDISNLFQFINFPVLTNIKTLRCTFNDLENLSFLKYFPNIKKLDCSANPITDISDVLNFRLEEFFIDNNEKIKSSLEGYKSTNPSCNFINSQSGTILSSFDGTRKSINTKKKSNYRLFQKEISNRKIEYLIHFTPTINLFSILENNELMSREILENLDIEQFDILDYIQFTDDVRYDDKNYINLSLSCPNTSLFLKFRQKTKDDCTINWCVIKINPKHIYDSKTLFSITNAASNAAKRQYGISGDLDKFKMLFTEQLSINTYNGVRTVSRNSVHSKYPTDVQAEILVKDKISSDSILAVCFESEEKMAEAKAAMYSFDTSKFVVDKEIFLPNRSI